MNDVSRQRQRLRCFIRAAVAPGGNSLGGFEQGIQHEGDEQFALQPRARGLSINFFQMPQLHQGFESLKGQLNLPATSVQFHHRVRGDRVGQSREDEYIAGGFQGFRAYCRAAPLTLALHAQPCFVRRRFTFLTAHKRPSINCFPSP